MREDRCTRCSFFPDEIVRTKVRLLVGVFAPSLAVVAATLAPATADILSVNGYSTCRLKSAQKRCVAASTARASCSVKVHADFRLGMEKFGILATVARGDAYTEERGVPFRRGFRTGDFGIC